MTEAERTMWTTFMPAIVALIATVGAWIVAFTITRKMETQKQRMELYKALYLERINAAKETMSLVGQTISAYEDYVPGDEVSLGKFRDAHRAQVGAHNVNTWIFSSEVNSASVELVMYVGGIVDGNNKEDFKSQSAHLIDLTDKVRTKLGNMMHNDDLSRLVKK